MNGGVGGAVKENSGADAKPGLNRVRKTGRDPGGGHGLSQGYSEDPSGGHKVLQAAVSLEGWPRASASTVRQGHLDGPGALGAGAEPLPILTKAESGLAQTGRSFSTLEAHLALQHPCDVRSWLPQLHTRELRLREGMSLARGHTVSS